MMAFLTAHWADVALALLTVDKVCERLFPNASIFKTVDSSLKSIGVKDIDGQ